MSSSTKQTCMEVSRFLSPRPELYMVYTGAPRQLPEILRLSDMYDGPGGAEIEIHLPAHWLSSSFRYISCSSLGIFRAAKT